MDTGSATEAGGDLCHQLRLCKLCKGLRPPCPSCMLLWGDGTHLIREVAELAAGGLTGP